MTLLEWETAKIVCTRQQLRALTLWRQGFGKRAIGEAMDIDPSTASQHVARGLRRIAKTLEKIAA